MKKGKLIVVSGPSGVGKDTVVSEYLKLHPEDVLSISMTSRPKRDYEVDGVHYYFRTKEGFEEEVAQGNLLEYALYKDSAVYKAYQKSNEFNSISSSYSSNCLGYF